MLRYLLLIMISCSLLFGDIIYLNNNQIIQNCEKTNETEIYLYYRIYDVHGTHIQAFKKNQIEKIVEMPIDKTIEKSKTPNILFKNNNQPTIKIDKQIWISFLAFGLAYDFYKDVEIYDDAINDLKEMNGNTKDLKEIKARKQKMAIFSLSVGIINTIVSFDKVKIESENQGVKLSYQF